MGVLAQAGPRRHLWRDWFNGPLYVPDEGRFVLNFLESDGPSGFLGELERLSSWDHRGRPRFSGTLR